MEENEIRGIPPNADPRVKELKKRLKAQKKRIKALRRTIRLAETAAQKETAGTESLPDAPHLPQSTNVEKPAPEAAVPVLEPLPIPAIGLTTILFKQFSTAVDASYDKYINYVAKQMMDTPYLTLHIIGHTDNTEKKKVSLQTTVAMVNEVRRAFLIRGISPARLTPHAEGSRNPVANNNLPLGKIRNRRVELRFEQ